MSIYLLISMVAKVFTRKRRHNALKELLISERHNVSKKYLIYR